MGEASRAILPLLVAATVGLAAGCSDAGQGGGSGETEQGWAEPAALAEHLDGPTALGQDRLALYLGDEQGLVRIVPKDGTRATAVAESFGVAADLVVAGDDVYWIDATWGRIWTLSVSYGQPRLLVMAQATPRRLAVDASYLYRIDEDGEVIRTSRLDGLEQTLSVGHQALGDLCLDDERVYFTDRDAGLVLAAPLAGGAVQYLAVGQTEPAAIAVDPTRVYWATPTAVWSLLIDEPEAEPHIVVDGLSAPDWLTAAGGHLYWSSASEGTVARVPKAGGTVEIIASGQQQPGALVVDAAAIYWVDHGAAAGTGALYQARYRFPPASG